MKTLRPWTCLWIGLALLMHAGCAGRMPRAIALRLTPGSLGEAISVQQHGMVERMDCVGDGCAHDFDAALEVDHDHLALVILMLGQRALSLHDDGKTMTVWRHPMLPAVVRPDAIVQDLQWMLWPTAVIQQALPSGWHLEETAMCRRVLEGATPVVVIAYEGMPRWRGRAILTHFRYRYRLTLDSVETEP